MRVLVVEDERRMALHLARALEEASFAVDVGYDGEQGLDYALAHQYDVIVLDLMLPKLDGIAVCRRLREAGKRVPVLMLSARDLVEDRVGGLNAGADDYLVKPFAMQELLARVHALMRRQTDDPRSLLKVADLELDPLTRRARRGSRPITLTTKEFAVLEYLMRRPTVVHTRTMIAEHVWNFDFDRASNVVDVYIKHLRDKIDDKRDPGTPSFIRSVRGAGYVLRDPQDDQT
ncbi:MAG: response regulator transcription factor [Acidobacteriota bacterium]